MKRNGERVGDRLDHTKLPDPVIEMLREMQKEIHNLKAELKSLQSGQQKEEQQALLEREEQTMAGGETRK